MQIEITFGQFLGFLAFTGAMGIGLWLFLLLCFYIIPYWIMGSIAQWFQREKPSNKS